jgi:hypothetical protein
LEQKLEEVGLPTKFNPKIKPPQAHALKKDVLLEILLSP